MELVNLLKYAVGFTRRISHLRLIEKGVDIELQPTSFKLQRVLCCS
jgi:hypothetical protein